MLTFVRGDMFEAQVDIRVNTVNCVGVMGAGVALAFKTRYPEMFRAYKRACDAGELKSGQLHVWKTLNEWIVNFPTKRHWREGSRYEDIESGLTALRDYLATQGTVRVALPALGCGHGGLDWSRVSEMIRGHLRDLDAQISVFEPSDSLTVGARAAATMRGGSAAKEIGADALAARRGEAGSLKEWGVERAFVLGDAALLMRPWLAIVLSAKPDAREETAAVACTDAIARSGITTALRYGGRVPRLLCEATLAHGANVVLWAVEGIDQVRPSKALQVEIERGHLAIVSVANPSARWNADGADRAALLQLELAQVALITDPAPVWPPRRLQKHELAHRPAIFYVRYGTGEPAVLDRLRHDGAHAVSRDSRTGLPKTAPVLAALGLSA
jgi:O-acetyl-ADP-ribose deacetylase (regulator of RNase III)